MAMAYSSIIRMSRCLGLALLLLVATGCQILPDKGLSCPASEAVQTGFDGPPRIRFGCYPSSTLGTFFLGHNLGPHGYYFRLTERNGIAYTCRGGHIDVIHARISADWTAYLASETFRHLMKHDDGFSYKLIVDRSRSFVQLSYPSNWDNLPQAEREVIAKDVAMALGPYLAFTMTTWHEILTWFGFRCIGLPTEFPSAFSWEDSFSNLLGTIIAVQALQDTEHTYNEAVKIALDREMEKLGVQPARVAKQASRRVKGEWFTGSVLFFVDIMKRNFDIGLEDGLVTPTLLPGVEECPDAEPMPYPVPNLDVLKEHGFSVTLEIESHEWERGKIMRVLFGDSRKRRIQPELHFPRLMEYLEQAAAEKYGPVEDYAASQ